MGDERQRKVWLGARAVLIIAGMQTLIHVRRQHRTSGFTLIELMVAVAVVAILGALAFPSYMDAVRKGRRADAVKAITAIQQAQERSRGSWPNYCSDLTLAPSATACGLNLPNSTPDGSYTFALANVSASGYDIVATASGGQAGDTRCAYMGVRMAIGGNLLYDAGTSTPTFTPTGLDPNRCWAK